MLERVIDKVSMMTKSDDETKARRLLAKREGRRRRLRGHSRAFVSVNLGLALINLVTALWSGATFPWVLMVLASWGMGFGIHWFGYRDWVRDNRRALADAELLVAQSDRVSMPPALNQPQSQPAAAGDPYWTALLERCQTAVKRAEAELDPALNAEVARLRESLSDGLTDLADLARGALRIQQTLSEIAPTGLAGLESQVVSLRNKVTITADARLQGVYRSNLALLEARVAKVRVLQNEIERIRASAEGFAIAAENARLDATRLEVGQLPALAETLHEPLSRLTEEVDILREVETELAKI